VPPDVRWRLCPIVGMDAAVLIGVAIALMTAGAWRFSKIEI
jgi:hypothetical protein